MSWEKMSDSKKGAGMFIRLQDGQEVEGVFRGVPRIFYRAFQDQTMYEEWIDGRSFRFRINFFIKSGDRWMPKIFEGGGRIRDLLLEMKKEYGLDTIYKIKRSGTGKDNTKYFIMFKGALSEKDKAEIDALPLLSLEPRAREEVPF